MDIELIIKSIMGLVVVLGLLIFLLFYLFPEEDKNKQKTVAKKVDTGIDISLVALKMIIKNRLSSSEKLSEALDLILKHHGTITKKTAGRTHADFDIYMDILFTICRHPNTDKNIIIKFDSALAQKNPEYKSNINDAVTKGLESRRVN